MGFTCGLYQYPKYKETTPKEVDAVTCYFEYDTNEWAKKQFKTKEEYLKYFNYDIPAEDALSFYKDFVHRDNYGHLTITEDIEWWCSAGASLHEVIKNLNYDVDNESVILSKDDLIKILNNLIKKLYDCQFEPASIYNAFTCKYDEETETTEYNIKHVDGVEIYFEDSQTLRRIQTDSDYGSSIIFPVNYIDPEEFKFLVEEIKLFSQLISEYDETKVIYYCGGW